MLEILTETFGDKVWNVAYDIRNKLLRKYGNDLQGKCIEASDELVKTLKDKLNIDSHTVEGWCIYDDPSGCSDRPYDEHTWVEIENPQESTVKYLDVTLDQFQHYIDEEIPGILICRDLPYYLTLEEPTDLIETIIIEEV